MAESILIFGGTFDPPHKAHTVLPPLVAGRLGCRRIIYVPAAVNPLKADEASAPAQHRLAMLRLALAGSPGISISTLEIDRAGPSYTVDTVEALSREHGPGVELRLLIGSDQALEFTRWHRWRRILQLATPVVMVRAPLSEAAYEQHLREAFSRTDARKWLGWTVEVPQMDICATRLRERLASGEDVSDSLDAAVAKYIREHGLYGAGEPAGE